MKIVCQPRVSTHLCTYVHICVNMYMPITKKSNNLIYFKHDHNLQLLWYQICSNSSCHCIRTRRTATGSITIKLKPSKFYHLTKGASQGPVPGSVLVIRSRFNLCHHVLYNLLKHIDIHSTKTNNGLFTMIHSTWGTHVGLNYS